MHRGTWRHRSCLDMDLVVLNVAYLDPEIIKLKVLYQNRHNGYFFDSEHEVIKLKVKDLKNWSKV